ncbi:tetratricopeptide repeat protein [Flavobacterium sp. CAU 1735]|uniref:tetratricopeptide repeat protein n=1 Tax=Flavobacterium sp. CAU 1735 TaxID=3140361 RepID=UPI0032610841
MNVNDLTYLLNKPQNIQSRQTVELEAVLHQFPYFQAARAIHLKGLYDENSFRYNQELKKTAAYTTDRSILFEFITSNNFTAIQQAFFEEKEAVIHDIIVNQYKVVIPEEDKITVPEVDPLEQSIRSSIKEAEPELETPEPEVSVTEQPKVETALEQSIRSSIRVAEPEAIVETELPEVEPVVTEPSGIESATEKLEIGKPLEFSKEEKHSFQEWLQLAKFSPIDREKPADLEEIDPEKKKKLDLIDKFIETNPKITPVKNTPSAPVNIEKSSQDTSYLMTETLAKVYLEQKKYQKAIQAYEILILKYPEKSHFFADRISDIKILQQNNN